MSVASLVSEMSEKLEEALKDAEKFDAGNKSAGTRVRNAMQDLKADAQAVRVSVTVAKNK